MQTSLTVQPLTYSLLDELELAYKHGGAPERLSLEIRHLGPLIQLQRSPLRSEIEANSSIQYGKFEDIARMIESPRGSYVHSSGSLAFTATSSDEEATVELMQRAFIAINRSSLPKAEAAQAASALGEFESNIQEHSSHRETGFLGFEVNEQFVGLYASDLGRGVVSSLRENPEFASVGDSGEALQLVIKEGVSSSGLQGRGMGFRPIFRGLASHSGVLRFRSGDALLEINGFGRERPVQELKERPEIEGFHVFAHCVF